MDDSGAAPSDSELIRLLEAEMRNDVRNIDVPPADEHNIDLMRVNEWYRETEKTIRVLGNLFSSQCFQSVNQLRYAGHHILKAQLSVNQEERQPNLIEAFKHCKRSLYDAFDFYIYRLNEYYRSLLPYLSSQGAIELENHVHSLIKEINDHRIQSKERISYYSGVQDSFIKGLELIEKLNSLCRREEISELFLKEKRLLAVENAQLRRDRDALEAANKQYVQQISTRANRLAILLTIIMTGAVVIGSAGGEIVSAWMTNTHKVTIANPIDLITTVADNKASERKINTTSHPEGVKETVK